MKLGKEEIQKIVLGAILLIGLVYCYFSMLLGPLQKDQENMKKKITELTTKITEQKKQISRVQTLEKDAPEHAKTLKELTAFIPEGSPVAWFPTRVAEHFRQYGVDKATTRLTNESPEKELTGFRNTVWGVEFQKVDFVAMGKALAAFENDQPLAELSFIEVDSLKDDVASQRVLFTVNHLVKQ